MHLQICLYFSSRQISYLLIIRNKTLINKYLTLIYAQFMENDIQEGITCIARLHAAQRQYPVLYLRMGVQILRRQVHIRSALTQLFLYLTSQLYCFLGFPVTEASYLEQ